MERKSHKVKGMNMKTLLNIKAIDTHGLMRTAKRLHGRNLEQPVVDIFYGLLEARCAFLAGKGLLFNRGV